MRDSIDVCCGKWKTTILVYLALNQAHSNCFLQIRRDLPGISAKMLSKELRDLEVNLLVKRTVQDTKPVTVAYAITEHGKTFIPVIEALIKWGILHRKVIKEK